MVGIYMESIYSKYSVLEENGLPRHAIPCKVARVVVHYISGGLYTMLHKPSKYGSGRLW